MTGSQHVKVRSKSAVPIRSSIRSKTKRPGKSAIGERGNRQQQDRIHDRHDSPARADATGGGSSVARSTMPVLRPGEPSQTSRRRCGARADGGQIADLGTLFDDDIFLDDAGRSDIGLGANSDRAIMSSFPSTAHWRNWRSIQCSRRLRSRSDRRARSISPRSVSLPIFAPSARR